MLPETTASVAMFAAVFVALFVAHQVADHWIQTQYQADCKGRPGWPDASPAPLTWPPTR